MALVLVMLLVVVEVHTEPQELTGLTGEAIIKANLVLL